VLNLSRRGGGQSPAWCVCNSAANEPVQTFHAELRRHALECCPQNVPRVVARWVCDAGAARLPFLRQSSVARARQTPVKPAQLCAAHSRLGAHKKEAKLAGRARWV
jgi:hypothetical protein